jgi:preprotein translocase subunit Sss1
MQALLTPEVTQSLLSLTGLVITGFVGWLAPALKTRWGVEVDERARQTLHSALNTGALIAWSRVSEHVDKPSTHDLTNILLRHVMGEGAGGAIGQLKVSHPVLRDLAEAKILEVGAMLGQRAFTALK